MEAAGIKALRKRESQKSEGKKSNDKRKRAAEKDAAFRDCAHFKIHFSDNLSAASLPPAFCAILNSKSIYSHL